MKEDVQRVLMSRAQALARPVEERPALAEPLDLLVFSLSKERYGIDITQVQDVVPLRDITPLPCAPPFVLGVVNHRGRILAVLDFRRLLDLAGEAVPGNMRLVVVEAAGMRFGIAVDGVAETACVESRDVTPPSSALNGDRKPWLRGVTGAMVAVLDLEALVRASRIVVNEEVG